jgi:hypothetical protein
MLYSHEKRRDEHFPQWIFPNKLAENFWKELETLFLLRGHNPFNPVYINIIYIMQLSSTITFSFPILLTAIFGTSAQIAVFIF